MYFRVIVDISMYSNFCMLFCHTDRLAFDSRTIKILYKFNKDKIKSSWIGTGILYKFITTYKV